MPESEIIHALQDEFADSAMLNVISNILVHSNNYSVLSNVNDRCLCFD